MTERTHNSAPPVPARPRLGYTLVELVTVGAIAATLLSISATAYFHWTRATTAETSLRVLESNLVRARSYALSRLCAVRVVIEEAGRGDLVVVELAKRFVSRTRRRAVLLGGVDGTVDLRPFLFELV